MQTKKHPKVDIEKSRSLYFLIGLALVLGGAIFFLELKFKTPQPAEPKPDEGQTATLVSIPITTQAKPEKPVAKTTTAKNPKKRLKPKPKSKPAPKSSKPGKPTLPMGGLSHVGMDPNPEPTPTVGIARVEKLAIPASCASEEDRSARLNCLNDWMQAYVARHTKYPEVAREMRTEGRIFVQFVISEMGRIEKAKVIRGEDQVLKQEALRVIKNMPAFTPASQMGQTVKMRMTVPVNFQLQ